MILELGTALILRISVEESTVWANKSGLSVGCHQFSSYWSTSGKQCWIVLIWSLLRRGAMKCKILFFSKPNSHKLFRLLDFWIREDICILRSKRIKLQIFSINASEQEKNGCNFYMSCFQLLLQKLNFFFIPFLDWLWKNADDQAIFWRTETFLQPCCLVPVTKIRSLPLLAM